jgi:hypothetical protein
MHDLVVPLIKLGTAMQRLKVPEQSASVITKEQPWQEVVSSA